MVLIVYVATNYLHIIVRTGWYTLGTLLFWTGRRRMNQRKTTNSQSMIFIWIFLAFDFCRFCVSHSGFFIPATTANDLRLWRIFYPRLYPLHFFSYLNSLERASISRLMLSAKQGNYLYHFYYVFGMTRSLSGDWTRDHPHSKPALYH